MTSTMMYNQMMAQTTFGSCANAASCCAKIAAVDAIFVASIIICALIPLALLVSVLAVARFVLVLVLLAAEYHHTPRSRRGA